MYTFNHFVFGHDLSVDKELNNSINELDIEFNTTINGKEFEVDFPYHGGQVHGDLYSCVFGHIITDDDNNKDYINKIRTAKAEDYIEEYNVFISALIDDLNNNKGIDDDYDQCVDKLIAFLQSNKPYFYTVEASS